MRHTLAALLALPSLAAADLVLLKNGGRLEGDATVEGNRVVILLESGRATFHASDVSRIVERPSPLADYRERSTKVPKDDAAGHLALADWCAEQGLSRSERTELEAAIAADPGNAAARARLGYEQVGGKWLRGAELLSAKGMQNPDGRWMTPDQADADRAARAARAQARSKSLDAAIEAAKARLRWRGFLEGMARVASRPEKFSRYRDERRGPGYASWRRFGYSPRGRHAPGHVVGLGGPITPFGLEGYGMCLYGWAPRFIIRWR
jgi:hypothetical protein